MTKLNKNFVDGEVLYSDSLNGIVTAINELDEVDSKKVDKVSGKGLSANDYTKEDKDKLGGVEKGAQVNKVSSVAGRTGAVSLTKADVGLGKSDNTSDIDKPISKDAKSALDKKVDKEDGKVLSDNNFSNEEKDKTQLIKKEGDGGSFLSDDGTYKKINASGGGFYNVTEHHPLESGYYTKITAIAALKDADVEDDNKPGLIITFESSQSKWEDYRFTGTNITSFLEPASWEEFGGKGAIKKITVSKGTQIDNLVPDAQGEVSLNIPIVEVDQTIDENSTNAVAGKAVASELKKFGSKYGAALQLNETGEANDKVYSFSLLDENGEVLSTSDQFSGGGGGSVATTKVVLTRITANPTVKNGDEVRLAYSFDHIDTTSGSTTGNSGKAIVTITHGATVSTFESTIAAGATQTIDVTKYIGVGSNSVRVKVTVGEGDEMQVSNISWTVNVVQLTLTSSFNIASVINKGDVVNIPYALSGSGTKTLRCYVDGVDKEDRSVTSSTANGSFSIDTSSMKHGSHSVQLVTELDLSSGGTIKSNSIYLSLAIRETGQTLPVVATRFDYPDGTIITPGARPYLPVKQYDGYTLLYAVYNPVETPAKVDIYEAETIVSSALVSFVSSKLTVRAMNFGEEQCRIVCGGTTYSYRLIVSKSNLDISEPTDNLTLKLSAQGRTNQDTNKENWGYGDITTEFIGFKWGGDGWMNDALRLSDNARAIVKYQPLKQPDQNVNNAFAFTLKFKVSEVTDDEAEVVKCVDNNGIGFVITTQEAMMQTKGNSKLSMKMAAGETYEIAFVSFPKAVDNSSEYEKRNTEMVYLYINGIMSGSVQRGTSDSIYQDTPQFIEMGANGCALDIYSIRSYSTYLSDSQVLDCFILDHNSSDELIAKYNENNVIDDNGNVTVDSVPDDMRYVIITGKQANGVPTVLQAAVTNNKKTKFDIDEILCVKRSKPELNFRLVGGCISLQGTSSLAYPIKNYRLYLYDANKKSGLLYLGCNAQGVGGTLQDKALYSFRLSTSKQKTAFPVNCFCLKADYAESSSSHNTGMVKLVQNVLTEANELTPAQRYADSSYNYDVRTTVDGEPCYLFYRATIDDTPVFLGKFNWNNDKSTEAVFGFLNIPGYHDQAWIAEQFAGKNPTECWEFLNNDYVMGMFKEADFDRMEDGSPAWLKVWEARFPDDDDLNEQYESGALKPKYLEAAVKWINSTDTLADGLSEIEKAARTKKFRDELPNYFDVNYLCDYYMFTDIFGCVDQRVKNMMLAFFYDPDKKKVLGYFIFYDCDTILGVRNDGRLKYPWDVDENTTDPELSTEGKVVYAYAGHNSVLWENLREKFPEELKAAYKRIRERMSNDTIFNMFDKEQSAKFCERIYNLDALNKYVDPKTLGVEVNQDGVVSNVKYSYLEAMQGSRHAHRHWWVTNRMGLFDARYSSGQYTATDISFKGNSAAGATIKATPARDFYFEFRREGDTMTHEKVRKGVEWKYTYNQASNIGTIFHLLGGLWIKKLDLSDWGGFTDVSLPNLPVLEELVMGISSKEYSLTELVLGNKLPMMRKLELVNYTKLPSLDLSKCNRLEEVNASGCIAMSTMSFAEGAPLRKLRLPVNYQTLTLRSLSLLIRNNIAFDNINSITGLWVENCSQLSGYDMFKELFALSNRSIKYVRVTDLKLDGDGSDLKAWYDAGLGGFDSQGNTINGKCKLCGTYYLTAYLNDSDYNKYVERFDELNIRQPQYTMIEFDDSVSDDANISNLDNKTGYKFGNSYVQNAHVSTILGKRFRCNGKQSAQGVMSICKLHNDNSYYYADAENVLNCTAAKLDSSEGDTFIYEPHYWYKGVNDYLNKKHYSCYSSNKNMPDIPVCDVISLEDIQTAGNYKKGYKLMSGKEMLSTSYSADVNYAVCRINVENRGRVRFPTVQGTNLICSLFTDNEGNIISTVFVDALESKFTEGMYLISSVPSGAAWLNFTIMQSAEFDKAVLSDSDHIEDMEPEWAEHTECLTGVFESSIVSSKLRSCLTGSFSSANLSWTDFNYYSAQRKMQQIDYEMHKDIANLFYARYGRRDSQTQCGAGQHSNNRITGGTVARGMVDTIGFDEAKSINNSLIPALVDNTNPQYAWYKETDENGVIGVKQVNNTCCLGYEDVYGDKYEMMDKVSLPNTPSTELCKWHIEMPDGTIRKVKGSSYSGMWITAVAHGKYMDVIPVGNFSGSASTYYCDIFYVSTAVSRVVYRGYCSAYANGGVSYAYAVYDSSNAYSLVGSRLAFRGKIEVAQSVESFKSLIEIA